MSVPSVRSLARAGRPYWTETVINPSSQGLCWYNRDDLDDFVRACVDHGVPVGVTSCIHPARTCDGPFDPAPSVTEYIAWLPQRLDDRMLRRLQEYVCRGRRQRAYAAHIDEALQLDAEFVVQKARTQAHLRDRFVRKQTKRLPHVVILAAGR